MHVVAHTYKGMMSCSYKSKSGKKAERARYPQLHRSAVEHARVKKTVAVIIMSVIMRYFMLFLFFKYKVTNNIYNFASFYQEKIIFTLKKQTTTTKLWQN